MPPASSRASSARAPSALGLLLGGILTEYLDWRSCLYVNLLLAVPAALGANAETSGWGNSLTLINLVLSADFVAVLITLERRVAHPPLPLSVVLDRNRGGDYLSGDVGLSPSAESRGAAD